MADPVSDERQLAASAFKAWGILATAWQEASYALWAGIVEGGYEESVPYLPYTDTFTVWPSAPTKLHVEMWETAPPNAKPVVLPAACVQISPAEITEVAKTGTVVTVRLALTGPVQMEKEYEGHVLDDKGQSLYANVSIVLP